MSSTAITKNEGAQSATIGVRRAGRLGAMALSAAMLAAAGCGGEGMEGEESEQALALPTPEAIAIDALKQVGQSVLTWIINDIRGVDPAGDMQRRFDAIDGRLKDIEQKVVDLSWVVRREEVAGVKRDIDRDRATKITTPLFQVQMFPDRAAQYEDLALSAAFTYSSDSFYWFTGPSSQNPTRFDHRMAAPTVIEAVNSWLMFRQIGGRPRDQATRTQLETFANQLAGRAQTIRDSVKCERVETPIYRKVNIDERRIVGCTITYPCVDKIAESFTFHRPSVQTGAACRAGRYFLPAETEALRAQYAGDGLQSVADTWRQLARL